MPADPDAWHLSAACTWAADPDVFFPDYRGNAQERAAKEICRGCPVRARCLEAALLTEETSGVWGGLSEHERTQLLRARPARRRRA